MTGAVFWLYYFYTHLQVHKINAPSLPLPPPLSLPLSLTQFNYDALIVHLYMQCAQTQTHVRIHTHMHARTHACTHAHTHTHTHTHAHAIVTGHGRLYFQMPITYPCITYLFALHVQVHKCTHTHTHTIKTHIYTWIHTFGNDWSCIL